MLSTKELANLPESELSLTRVRKNIITLFEEKGKENYTDNDILKCIKKINISKKESNKELRERVRRHREIVKKKEKEETEHWDLLNSLF